MDENENKKQPVPLEEDDDININNVDDYDDIGLDPSEKEVEDAIEITELLLKINKDCDELFDSDK